MPPFFLGLDTKNQKLKKLLTFAFTFAFLKYPFKDIFSRASSSDVSAHFIAKSPSTFISLKELDNFCNMSWVFVEFYSLVCFHYAVLLSL